MKHVYLALAVVILILQDVALLNLANTYGASSAALWQMGKMLAPLLVIDFIVSAVVFFTFIEKEAKKYQINNSWAYLVCSLSLGCCFTLPLFLYVREGKRELVSHS